jgi:hypothetical protein
MVDDGMIDLAARAGEVPVTQHCNLCCAACDHGSPLLSRHPGRRGSFIIKFAATRGQKEPTTRLFVELQMVASEPARTK